MPDDYRTQDYYPTAEDIAEVAKEVFDWSRNDLIGKMIQHEHTIDEYGLRLISFDRTVENLKLIITKLKENQDLIKSMYRMKLVRAGLVGTAIGVVVSVVAIVLVRLAYTDKI